VAQHWRETILVVEDEPAHAARRRFHSVYALDSICVMAYIQSMTSPTPILAALAEPTRLGAIRLLWDGREHCVCELMQHLGVTQSRMSRHMAQLKRAGLVTDRRDAQWVRYRRNPALPKSLVRIVDAVLASLAGAGARRAA
jgi:ArsR family transcriptional regulator